METTVPQGMVVVYARDTGAAVVRWPVDARELLASGGFTADPPISGPDSHPAPVSPEVERPRRAARTKAA